MWEWRAGPTPHFIWWCGPGRSREGRHSVPPIHPLPPVAGEKAGPGVKRAGELSVPVTSCSNLVNDASNSSGQHSKAGLDGLGASDPSLRNESRRTGPIPLFIAAKEWTKPGNAGELTLVVGTRKAGGLTNPAGQDHSYELAHPNSYPIYDLWEYGKRLVLQTQSPTTQRCKMISKRSSNGGTRLIVYLKLEILN